MANGEVLVVVEVQKIHDADEMRLYQEAARAQFGRYGGSVIARGGDAVEGEPPFGGVLVQKWPSAQAFRDWQASEEYRPLMERRRACAEMRISIVPIVI